MDRDSHNEADSCLRSDSTAWGGHRPFGVNDSDERLNDIERPTARRTSLEDRSVAAFWRDLQRLDLAEAKDRIDAAERKLLLNDVQDAKQGYGYLFALRAIVLALEDDTFNAPWAADYSLRLDTRSDYARFARLVVQFCAWKVGAAPASVSDSARSTREAIVPSTLGAPPRDKNRRMVRGGDNLTMREKHVLKLIAEGRTNKMIAQSQGIAPETVKTHVKNIFAKLGVERRAQAVVKAQRLGLMAT